MLSICITSLYDGDLLNSTIRSFYRPDVEFSIVFDYQSPIPDTSEFDNYPNVKIFKSTMTLGSSQGKQLAVNNSTGDVILILDAHMIPVNPNWYDCIKDIGDGVYFSHTRPWIPSTNKFLDESRGAGCYLGYTVQSSPVDYCLAGMKKYPICMGAGYVMKRSWFDYIGGFSELSGYGYEELLISLLSWGLGGTVETLDGLELGHVYGDEKPKNKHLSCMTDYEDNLLLSLYALMDEEDRELVLKHQYEHGLGRLIHINPSKFDRFEDLRKKYLDMGYDYSRFKEINTLYRDKYAVPREVPSK